MGTTTTTTTAAAAKVYVCVVLLLAVVFRISSTNAIDKCSELWISEATIEDIQEAFKRNELTSRQLVEYYLHRIEALNPMLRAVLEVNPDARDQADKADRERREDHRDRSSSLHGIPVLLKDSIATLDKLNTTAGSYALLESKVPRDAHVVSRLRDAGAIILGKASLTVHRVVWDSLSQCLVRQRWICPDEHTPHSLSSSNHRNRLDLNNLNCTEIINFTISKFKQVINLLKPLKSNPNPTDLSLSQYSKSTKVNAYSISSTTSSFMSSITGDRSVSDGKIGPSILAAGKPPLASSRRKRCHGASLFGKVRVKLIPCETNDQSVPAISSKITNILAGEYLWRKYGQKPIKGSPYPR